MIGALWLLLVFYVTFLMVSYWIPMLAISIATNLVGNAGKLSEKDTFKLKVRFYLVTGFLIGLGTCFLEPGGIIDMFFRVFFGMLFWPIGFTLQVLGVFKDDAGSAPVMYGCLFMGMVITQLLAIKMVLDRAEENIKDLD